MGEHVSERRQIADEIAATISGLGLTQPFGGTVNKVKRNGRPIYSILFAMPAILDGVVEVYGKTFIRIATQGPAARPTKIARSKQEALDFINENWGDEDYGLEPPVHYK